VDAERRDEEAPMTAERSKKTKFGAVLEGAQIDCRLISLIAGIHMDHVIRLCYHDHGRGPTLYTISRLVSGCSVILHRDVKAEELFSVNDGRWRIVTALDELLPGALGLRRGE
jgi:hypothetical protein